MKIKTIIVDDEEKASDFVKLILGHHFPDILVSGVACSTVQAIKMIVKEKPQLVFLDIELPDGTGFDILEAVDNNELKVIFVSAFNEYALKAFRYSAVDFIIKPVDIETFISSVTRVLDSINRKVNYKILLENITSEKPVKIAIPTTYSIEYEVVNNIIRIEADGRYSDIYTADNKKAYKISKNIGYFEDILFDSDFLRVHKSHFINLNFVKRLLKKDGVQIEMSDKSIILISREKKDIFQQRMQKFLKKS